MRRPSLRQPAWPPPSCCRPSPSRRPVGPSPSTTCSRCTASTIRRSHPTAPASSTRSGRPIGRPIAWRATCGSSRLAGGAPRQLTFTGRDGNARWSPDGSRLAFLSSRDGGTTDLPAQPHRRRADEADDARRRRRPDRVGARRQEPRVHLVGVARLRRRRVQQAQERGQGERPGEGAGVRRPALSPLDRLGHGTARAPVRGASRRRHAEET